MKKLRSRAWNPELSAERRVEVDRLVEELPERVSALKALREALGLSQGELAELLKTTQSSVSKLESKADVRLDKLRKVVEGRGGRLRIVAEFPDRELELPV